MLKLSVVNIIRLIHYSFIIYIIVTPFIANKSELKHYLIIVVLLLSHWITNNDTCALSMLESKLRKMDTRETFVGRIVSPIYSIKNEHVYLLIYILVFIAIIRLKS